MAKKTDGRVKRTEAWIRVMASGHLDTRLYLKQPIFGGFKHPVTIIDRRELAALEARLKAAEAELKNLRRQSKISGAGNDARNIARPLNKRTHRRRPHV